MTDPVYTVSELARLAQIDRATAGKRLVGVPMEGRRRGAHLYQLSAAMPALIPRDSEFGDTAKENRRRASAQADLLELKLQREQRKLIPATIACRVWESVLIAVRRRILAAGLPLDTRDDILLQLQSDVHGAIEAEIGASEL